MTESLTSSICKLADAMVMSDSLGADKLLCNVGLASSCIKKTLRIFQWLHAKGISVEETELTKVKDIIKESFNIEDDIIIQRFDKIWEEFIDINCNEELQD
jgi:hypothetical protein